MSGEGENWQCADCEGENRLCDCHAKRLHDAEADVAFQLQMNIERDATVAALIKERNKYRSELRSQEERANIHKQTEKERDELSERVSLILAGADDLKRFRREAEHERDELRTALAQSSPWIEGKIKAKICLHCNCYAPNHFEGCIWSRARKERK